MRVQHITEAQFRQPRIMYHGTSSTFLPSIMKNGLIPNPPKGRWDTDDQQSQHSFSRVSLPGSYWTSNYMTASSSATNTMKKYGGEEIIVIAQIAEQSSYADEDSINRHLMSAMGQLVEHISPGINTDFWTALGQTLFVPMSDEEFADKKAEANWYKRPAPLTREGVQDLFSKLLHQQLGGSDQHQPNRQLTDALLDNLVLRHMAFEIKNNGGKDYNVARWVDPMPTVPPIPELEQQLLVLRDQLTRSYRATSFYTGQFNHTLRTPDVVGFRGANRILTIIQAPRWRWVDQGGPNKTLSIDPMILVYGNANLPDDFLEQYRQRVGKFPGLVDTQGNILIPSQRDEPAPMVATEAKKVPGPQLVGSGKDFRQQAGTNKSGKQPGRLVGSGKPIKVKPGFVG